MTTENRRVRRLPFKPRAFLAAFGLALALVPSSAHAIGCVTSSATVAGINSIQGAVNSAGFSLSGDHCVSVGAGAYNEQVTISNINTNGFRIIISSAPGAMVMVSPPASSTAAFRIANASVTIQGIAIVASQSVPYGVWASSAFVELTNVSVSTSGSLGIYTAGVRISSWSAISYSSVTVWNAHGYWLDGSTKTTVSFSTAVNNSATSHAVYLTGGKNNAFTVISASNSHVSGFGLYALDSTTNTVTQSYLWGGNSGAGLDPGSNYNAISLSTMIGKIDRALFAYLAASNTVTQSYMWGGTIGAFLNNGANYNAISLSTMIGNSGFGLFASTAVSNTVIQSYMWGGTIGADLLAGTNNNVISLSTMIGNTNNGLYAIGAASNTVTQSYVWGGNFGAWLDTGSGYNTISLSTMIGNTNRGLYASGAASNTVTQSYMWGGSRGAWLDTGSGYNAISLSTMIGNSNTGFYASGADSNTVTQSYLWGGVLGAWLDTGSDYNAISLSTMIGNSNNGIDVTNADSNTVTQSYISGASYGATLNPGSDYNTFSLSTIIGNSGVGLYALNADSNIVMQSYLWGGSRGAWLNTGADFNAISFSTMISNNASNEALFINQSSSSTILNSYVQGSTATLVSGSTGTVIRGSIFVATSTIGSALVLANGSVNLTIATSTLLAPSQGRGLALNPGNLGVVSLGSVTFSGAARGIEISTQGAGFALAVDSITFRGLASGGAAVHFLGGTFVSTFALANFEDASIGVNVNAAPLSPASRITMVNPLGPRGGPGFEIDPSSLVDWPPFAGIAAGPFSAVTGVALTANWTSSFSTSTSYAAQLSTAAFPNNNSGNQLINTTNLNAIFSGLSVGTQYFARVSTSAATGPYTLLGSTVTPGVVGISPLAYTAVSPGGLTANWNSGFANGTTYYVQISSDAFATFNSSFLTLNTNFVYSGLTASLTYDVRVSTKVSVIPFTSLGPITLPAAGGGAVNFNFFNNGPSAVVASANGQNEAGIGAAVDRNFAGGPYSYVIFGSTPGATASRNIGHDTAGVVGLVKYGPSGTMISSRTLAIDSDGAMASDDSGNLYVAEMDKIQPNHRWITKYGPSLNPIITRTIPGGSSERFGSLAAGGTSVYALIDSPDNTVKVVIYDSSLVALATATYALGGVPVRGHGFDGDQSGYIYVLVSSAANPAATVHLLKYSAGALNGSNPIFDVVIPDLTTTQEPSITVAAGKVYVAFSSPTASSIYVREFNSALGYTGVTATITNIASPFGKSRALIKSDGSNVFVAGTVNTGGGGDYLVMKYDATNNLAFVSSATFNSVTFLPDQAFGMAVGQSGDVYITGASSDTISNANAVTTKFSMGAGGGQAGTLAAAAYTGVSLSNLTANWASSFPGGTLYYTGISTNAFATLNSTGSTTALFFNYSSLSAGTTYSVRVSTVFAGPFTDLGVVATPAAGAAISGTVSYGGFQPGVIKVEAFTTPAYTGVPNLSQTLSNASSQAYYLPVAAGTYYLKAWVDVLGNGSYQTWADTVFAGSYISPISGQNFTIAVDTVAPSSLVGVSASPSAGQISVTWAVPSSNANGTTLMDLRGYIVERSTGGGFNNLAGSPANPISSATLTFTDFNPVPNVTNSYRVVAVDFGQNLSAPSAPASVVAGGTASGGTISGMISSFTATSGGIVFTRLFKGSGEAYISQSNQNPYSFPNLSTGTYYVKGFIDLDSDGVQDNDEPAGTGGGLHNNPHSVFIFGTEAPIRSVTLCDRSLLQVGSPVNATLASNGCPALDAGPNRRTNLLSFGTGSGGAISTGTALSISMTRISSGGTFFDSRLVVLGPSGQMIASNSSPDGAAVSFTPTEFGVYVVEPTSNMESITGAYTVTMNAGASGLATEGISGTVSYGGTQGGNIVVRFFPNSSFSGIPLATQTVPGASGPYSQLYLPAGTYTVDAYRDTSGFGFNPAYQAYGRCNDGFPVTLAGGSIDLISNICTLNDPASGTNGTSGLSGNLYYPGAVTGMVRTFLFPSDSDTPARQSDTSFSANTAFNFSAISSGTYLVKAFVDANNNFQPDASEPVIFSTSTGFIVETGINRTGANFTLCDRAPIVPGTPVTFSLSPVCRSFERADSFMKLYTFYGQSNQPVTISADAVNFTDSYLYLYDPDGNLVATDDDSGGSFNAKLSEFVLPLNGIYTVGAGPYGSDVSGQINLSVSLSGGALGSIAGAVEYTGTQGGSIQVALFNSPSFSSSSYIDGRVLTSTRVFTFDSLLSDTTYYLGAFIDVNFNNNPDPGEDKGQFGLGSAPSPIYLLAGQNVTGATINISPSTAALANGSHVTGSVFYSGARTGSVILEFWPTSQFTGSPVAVRNIPTGVVASTATYDVLLPGGANYFLRAFMDTNNDFMPNPDEPRGVYAPSAQGAEAIFVPSNSVVTGINITMRDPGVSTTGVVSGQGSAALLLTPATLKPGQPATIEIVYTAGAAGIGVGGTVGFSVPNGFPFPGPSFSSVSVTNTGGTLSPVNYAGASVFVNVTAGAVASGQTITFKWGNFSVPCAVGVQTVTVSAVQSGGAPPSPLFGGSPSVSIGAGAPFFFQPKNPYFTLVQGERSEAQLLEARDLCGNAAPLLAGSTVSLHSAMWSPAASNFVSDPSVNLSDSVDASTTSNLDLFFATGASTRAFFVVGTSTGFHQLQMFFNLGTPSTYYAGLSVVPGNALTGVRVSSSTTGQALSITSIAAAASGVINPVFVNFTLGDPQQSWRVLFSSAPLRPDVFPTPVWERWGFGQPNPSEVVWDGRYSPWLNGGGRVPNGLYYGRVELGGGGVKNDSIRVNVALPQFAGRAYDSGTTPNPPLSGVQLRVYGPSGYYTATTGADGSYVLPGLGAGSYRVNINRPEYVDGVMDMTLNAAGAATSFIPRTAGVLVSSNATGGLDLFIGRSPRLIVVPALGPSVAAVGVDQWGSLQVRPSTASQQSATFYGPMRLQMNTTTFDDGGQWDSGTQQFVAKTLLSFNVPVGTYTVVGDLSGYSRSTGTVYVGPSGARLDLAPFVPKAVVSGQVTLPVIAPPGGTWVGVSAVAMSTGVASSNLSGGAFINGGALTGPYSISGFDSGSYLLRANTQGYGAVPLGLPVVVVGTIPVTGQNFPAFGAGASISGTITIAGGIANGTRIFINAWAPGSFGFGSTMVYTAGGAAAYALNGLDAGATYQLYVDLDAQGHYDVAGGFPIKVIPPAPALNFTMTAASGAVVGLIILPAGNTDFLNVTMIGHTIASSRPNDVGKTFVEISTTLPNFSCGGLPASNPSSSPVAGYCTGGVSSATFLVEGLNTETIDMRFLHSTTGQSSRQTLSIVNGATSTLTADLRALTYSISGSIINQITDALFNTNEKIVANAPFIVPLGYPAGLSSSTARMTAVRQEIDTFGVAISTIFNPVSSRVGFIATSGTFTIANVPNGAYLVRTLDLRSCSTCQIIAPSVSRLVTVSGASVSSVTLTLSNGYSISGTLTLDDGLLDSGVFDIRVLNRRQEVVRSTTSYLGDAGLGQPAASVDYTFTNLPAGEFYTLVVKGRSPVKYAGRPIKFPDPALSPNGLQSNLTGQNVLLQRAGFVVGRMRDAGTGELIGANNATLLAPNFAVTATANPWTEGGFVAAASSVSARPVDSDGYFRVGPLLPSVSYDLRLAQATWDPGFLASGSQNYAPVTIAGLKLTAGEVRDVGVVSLGQGLTVTGVVRSTTTGLTLGNIKVTARPSFGGDDLVVQSFTNSQGAYSLWVSTLVSNQFTLTAAPRDGNLASDGRYYGTVALNNVNLRTQTSANFLLTPLAVVVTGQVLVADAATGGALSYPFGDKRAFPAAAVNLQPSGVVSSNPLGDIEVATDERGFFTVPGLSTGIYSLHATSLGYSVFKASVQVIGATFRIFIGSNTPTNDLPMGALGSKLTLARGATATGRILKSDGSAPNSSEVVGIAAANFGADEFVVGSVEVDPVAKTVNAYTISGFKTGVSYSIVLLSGSSGEEISFPAEGAGVIFAAAESTTTKTINLTYRPAALDCLGTAKALNAGRSRFSVQIDCLKPLRQETAADDDLTAIFTVSTFTKAGAALTAPNGAGVVSDRVLSSDRRSLTATYTLSASEARFSMRVRAAAAELDPSTGDSFLIDKVFDFYAGLDSSADGRATNINGGKVGMKPSAQDELLGLDERSGIDLPPGAFGEGSDSLADAGIVANPTTTVNISMTKGLDQALAKTLSIAALGYAPAALEVPDNPSAFPAEMWAAMSQYRTAASTSQIGGANPISAFYSIFLPAGIRHQLKERADLTLSYNLSASTSTTDDKIQIWFYNAVLGRFVPETVNRRLDTVNKTITVSVDHFSTFVVLDSTPVATSSVSFGGADIQVANFPNPADCITHSNIARNSTLFGSGGVHAPFVGTMIRTSIPNTGTTADLKIHIYTVTGERIRTIEQGAVPVGQTYYTPWNCTNEGGRTVASGIYIGEAVHGGRHRFFKIAIIKGSGL